MEMHAAARSSHANGRQHPRVAILNVPGRSGVHASLCFGSIPAAYAYDICPMLLERCGTEGERSRLLRNSSIVTSS